MLLLKVAEHGDDDDEGDDKQDRWQSKWLLLLLSSSVQLNQWNQNEHSSSAQLHTLIDRLNEPLNISIRT